MRISRRWLVFQHCKSIPCLRQFADISDSQEDESPHQAKRARVTSRDSLPELPPLLPFVSQPEDFVLGNGEDGVADETLMMSQELRDLLAVCIEIWKLTGPKDSKTPAPGEHLRLIERQPKKKRRCLNSRIFGDESCGDSEWTCQHCIENGRLCVWSKLGTRALTKPFPKKLRKEISPGEAAYYLFEDNKRAAEEAFIEQDVNRIRIKMEDKEATPAYEDIRAAMRGYWEGCARGSGDFWRD